MYILYVQTLRKYYFNMKFLAHYVQIFKSYHNTVRMFIIDKIILYPMLA